jgi:hypothetical protein
LLRIVVDRLGRHENRLKLTIAQKSQSSSSRSGVANTLYLEFQTPAAAYDRTRGAARKVIICFRYNSDILEFGPEKRDSSRQKRVIGLAIAVILGGKANGWLRRWRTAS